MRTRVIDLADGQDRAAASNARTMAMIGPRAVANGPSAIAILRTQWSVIRAAIAVEVGPGVSIVAIDASRGRVAGSMWIAAKPGVINAGFIGRHSQCDLFLDGDPSVSLRHLMIVVDPARDWGGPGGADVQYRLIDLRTGTGFVDESGRALEAITALGPAFVRIGRYLLCGFPTGGDEWPMAVDAAMAMMPERIYVDDRDAEPDRWRRRPHGDRLAHRPLDDSDNLANGSRIIDSSVNAGANKKSTTGAGAVTAASVTAVHGPARARVDGDASEIHDGPVLGYLELSSRLGRDVVSVGEAAAERGYLLGRYSRCDTAGAQSLALDRISRVHVMVIAIDGVLWVIDAASTNGITVDGRTVRINALSPEHSIELGGVGTLRWVPVN